MTNKETVSTDNLIEALYKQERHPDLDLIRTLLERGDEVVPVLIDIVETDTGWPQTHAVLLLCELRAEPALPALQQAISNPEGQDLADWLADDALEKFGPVILDMVETVAADKKVAWYPRAVAGRVMMVVAYRHPETYDRVTAFLRGLLPDPDLDWQSYGSYEAIKEAEDDPQVWTSVVGDLCDLRDPAAYDLIGQLFQTGLVDEMSIDQASYQAAYQRLDSPTSFRQKPIDLLTRYERNLPKSTQPPKKKNLWSRLWKKK